MVICLTINLFAQNALTNIYTGNLESNGAIDFKEALHEISAVYNVSMSAEFTAPVNETIMAFTNETLLGVMDAIIGSNTNYLWRYENQTDRIYIHPKTNSVLMMRCDSISITNTPLMSLYEKNGIPKFNEIGLGVFNHSTSYHLMTTEVSLELENPFVWQVLDAILTQLPDVTNLYIQKPGLRDYDYTLFFVEKIESEAPDYE